MYHQVFKLHADLLKAISHPKRLEIISLLGSKKLCVAEIEEMLDIPQANLSQHLGILRDAGVVETNKKGKNVFYKISDPNFIKSTSLIREFLIKKYKNTDFEKILNKKMSDLVPLAHDPVCKTRLCPKTAPFSYKYKKRQFYFCKKTCLDMFKKNPDKYLD